MRQSPQPMLLWQNSERETMHYVIDSSCSRSGGGTTTRQLTEWQGGRRANSRIRTWQKFWKKRRRGWIKRNGKENETRPLASRTNLNVWKAESRTMEALLQDHTTTDNSHPCAAAMYREVEAETQELVSDHQQKTLVTNAVHPIISSSPVPISKYKTAVQCPE